MSDYEDDFEEGNDTFNDRTGHKNHKKETKKGPIKPTNLGGTSKNSSYDNTFARDHTLGIKGSTKNPLKSPLKVGESKPKGLSKKGNIYSSTPNLQNNRKESKKSLLSGGNHINTHRKLTNFGLTKKAEQTIIPSKQMTLEQAEKLMEEAKVRIEEFKHEKDRSSGGNMDERLEISIKENKFLQKTLMNMQDVINKLFEKYDPVKAPMKSYPQTERIKSPPKSVQMKYRTKEVENAQHALENMMEEYAKVSARMEMIKDPSFFSNLHLQLDNINKEMKELEKENKALHTEQKKREIEMEKLLAQGAPDTMFQINDLQNKVTITKDQLRKEEKEREEVETLMQQVEEQEKLLKEKEEKLRSKYDINFDTQVDEKKQIEAEQLQDKKQTYGKHLAIAESATKVMRKKLKTMSKVNKAKLKELQNQKEEYEKELELKTQQVKEKNKEIADLMEKNTELQKIRHRESNQFLGEDKNDNGYDAVQKAIQEQDEKEAKATVLLQSWCRVILAKKLASKLRKEKEQAQKSSKSKKPTQEKGSSKKQITTSPEVESPPKRDKLKDKKSQENVFLKKRDSIEKPMEVDNNHEDSKREDQKAKLQKATSKPTFGKKKVAKP